MASKTFTILHTNDTHSNLVGVGPASDYTPFSLNDDHTIGGIERISALIAERRRLREADGPVLVLDSGDFSIGTPFGGAIEELGTELQCMSIIGYDATTFGNHEFDSGPAALGRAIAAAHAAGRVPQILASNTNFGAVDSGLNGLQELVRVGVVRSHIIVERGGIRFGLFGLMGTDSIQFTVNPGALVFDDPIETAKRVAKQLRHEGADVVVCLSHGGVRQPENGPITEGDDVNLAREVPEIDVIIGGHTHTFIQTPVIVNGTPIVQAGCYYKAVGELVVSMEGRDRRVISYGLLPVDDTILGDSVIAEEMVHFTAETSRIVFAARGLRIDEPLAVVDCDWSNSFLDLEASRPLGNVTADALRQATNADVGLNAAGMVRAGLTKGISGMQTAYDVFLIAPLGLGVEDQSAGGSLIVTYLTGRELKNCLEFLLAGNPNQPGQYFPRVSGMRFRYDMTRPRLDAVTQIELGDITQGYRAVDISQTAERMYSVACNLYLGIMLISMSKKTGLPVIPKNKDGSLLQSRADALPSVQSGPYMLPPKGQIDKQQVVHGVGTATSMEIKEWQAIMNYLKGLPTKNEKGVTTLVMDDVAKENRSVEMSAEQAHG